jgi:hypothetical protein
MHGATIKIKDENVFWNKIPDLPNSGARMW